jgi:cytochrome c556
MMSLKTKLALAALALAGSMAASAQGSPGGADPTPQQVVAARQAAYHLSGATMGSMKAALDGGAEVRNFTYAARGIARWARVLPTMFPESTRGVGPTRARPEIWANRADFNARAAAYAEAAAALAAAAQSNDRAAFTAQFEATIATCRACHDAYQVPPPAAPQPPAAAASSSR